jgi:E3 ubiquitin-protein ligase SHPRH
MQKVSRLASSQSFTEVPEFKTDVQNAGLESRRIIEQLELLASSLDTQANVLDEWRERLVQLLLRPLVDEDDDDDVTGEEYEESTKNQDEIFCYVQALRAVIADRHGCLTGQENKLIAFELTTAQRLAKEGEGPFPEKTLDLLQVRQQLKTPPKFGSVRGVVAGLRALATSIRPEPATGSARVLQELSIVETQLSNTQKHLSQQTKATAALEKEVELFTNVMNARLEYYRQLQQLSDSVAPCQPRMENGEFGFLIQLEAKLQHSIAASKAKRRYLEHLRQEASNPRDKRICVICRDTFEIGAITVCGHQYCKECIAEWWNGKSSSPSRT